MKKFPIHLCHPDNKKSCAACCGIYNFKSNGKTHIAKRLRRNTQAFLFARKTSSISDFIRKHSALYRAEDNGDIKCFQTIFNCEFAGFVDERETKVGCLLHPVLNDGRDFRNQSFYGDNLCNDHFCLSYYYLSIDEQLLVIKVVDDWYLYGLTITDIDLVKGVYQILSNKLGETLNVDLISSHSDLSNLILRFFTLKLDWPYSSEDENRFGKYIFKGEEYREIRIDYGRLHRKRSIFHPLFKAYGSEFKRGCELDEAEDILTRMVDNFCRIYSGYARL